LKITALCAKGPKVGTCPREKSKLENSRTLCQRALWDLSKGKIKNKKQRKKNKNLKIKNQNQKI
jgi:hypothetical protein